MHVFKPFTRISTTSTTIYKEILKYGEYGGIWRQE